MKPVRQARFLLSLLAATLGIARTVAAEPVQWKSEPGAGDLAWSAYYDGESLPGRFERFDVKMETDEKGAPVSLVVEVEIASANMNDREINEEIADPEWFDTAAFPSARYESRDIRAEDGGFLAYGMLRLKGLEQTLELPLQWQADTGELGGAIRMSRRDWRIGTGEWSDDASLSDRVDLHWRVILAPAR